MIEYNIKISELVDSVYESKLIEDNAVKDSIVLMLQIAYQTGFDNGFKAGQKDEYKYWTGTQGT